MTYIYLSTCKYSPASAIIRWNTRCVYSHCGFYDSTTNGYLSAQLNGGVRWRYTYGKDQDKENFTRVGYFTAPRTDDALEWAKTQIGKQYDRTAIFGIALNRDWHEDDSWFCSELVAASFENVGAPLLNTRIMVYRVVPENILLSPWVDFAKEHWTGSMRSLRRQQIRTA